MKGRLVNVKDADAHLTVICPRSGLCGEMKHRIFDEKVVDVWHDRYFLGEEELDEDVPEDEENSSAGPSNDASSSAPTKKRKRRAAFDMVLTAIDDSELSRRICYMCRERRIPVNVADVPPECDFYFGSLIRRGPLQIMVSTGGQGPRIAAQTRQILERAIPLETGPAILKVGQLRAMLRKIAPDQKQGARRMRWMIDVCDSWTLDQLAEMDEADMHKILAGWEAGRAPSYREVKGTNVLGVKVKLPKKEKVYKNLFGVCPVVHLCSPWLTGILGTAAGAAAATAFFMLKSARTSP